MDTSLESAADEAERLRRCVNDLVSIMALPAVWAGREPSQIVSTLLDTLLGMLPLAFVFARLNDPEGGPPTELVRMAEAGGAAVARQISDSIGSWLGDAPPEWPPSARVVTGVADLSFASARLGIDGEIGIIVAGSPRLDFPGDIERLLLDVAANQAAIALQQARLLSEQTRRANESERESRLIVDSIPGLVALLSPTGYVEMVNRPLLEYFGQSLEELRQWGTNGTVHPEDLPHVVDVFTRSITSGTPYEIVQRLRRADGIYRWIQNSGFPLRDTSGQIARWCVLLTDIDDRQRAEEVLLKRERELRLLVETIPALMWRGTAQGELDYLNERAVEYLGHTAESLSGGQWLELVHPDHRDATVRRWLQSVTTGSSYDDTYKLRRADGQYRWIQSVGEPLHDGDGRIVHWYGSVIDIDDLKRTEEALRESERESRLIVDSIPGLVAVLTPAGELDAVNSRVVEYCGRPLEELKHWTTNDTIHREDRSRVIQLFAGLITSGLPSEWESRIRRFDGVYRWFQCRGLPLRDVTGRVARWYVLLTDIDDLKRAEAELRRAYDHLTEAQRLSQTGSFTADLERDEHYWSDEFYRICEFEPGSTVTIRRLGEIVHPEDVALYEGAIGRAMAGTDPDFYFRIVTSRGVVKHLRGFAHRIADRPVFVGAVQDVTASKMAQEALNKAGAELAHVSRLTSLSALTASIAHEVNQPLSGIITNAGTCLRMLDAVPPNIDGARETARRTIRDGNRASDVIARLRVLFTKREFTLEPVDLNEATREVIALSSNELQRNRIVLQSELAGDLPIVIGDRIQLQQVILNLLRNASDAMGDVHDRVRLLLIKTDREDGTRVRLTIRDAGVGLPRESVNSVFDAFYTTKSGGMGIGLFVSRSIIERHHGRLWAEPNDAGPGATFSFSIPQEADGILNGVAATRT